VVPTADEDDVYPHKELSLELILAIEEPELVLIEEEVTAKITKLEVFVLREEESAVIEPAVIEPAVIEPVVEPEVVEGSLDNEDSSTPPPLLGTLAGARLTMENVCAMCRGNPRRGEQTQQERQT